MFNLSFLCRLDGKYCSATVLFVKCSGGYETHFSSILVVSTRIPIAGVRTELLRGFRRCYDSSISLPNGLVVLLFKAVSCRIRPISSFFPLQWLHFLLHTIKWRNHDFKKGNALMTRNSDSILSSSLTTDLKFR